MTSNSINTEADAPQAVDPRLVFLLRASARWDLVDAGEMTLDEAFADLVPALDGLIEVAA